MKPSRCNAQTGAAMIEFVVAALFFLLPLYLAIQAIGKFADVRHTADAAARYAAWERTVWYNETTSVFHAKNQPNQKSDAAIRNEIATRLMNDREGVLRYRAGDRSATSFSNGLDPLWQDTAGVSYLGQYGQASGSSDRSTPARDFLGNAISLINRVSIPSITGQLAPPVPTDNLIGARYALTGVARDSNVYQRLWSRRAGLPDDWTGLDIQTQAGILSNTWAANSSVGTTGMVSESVPTAKGLGDAVQLGAWALAGPWDPTNASRLDMGKIGVDAVPADRLR